MSNEFIVQFRPFDNVETKKLNMFNLFRLCLNSRLTCFSYAAGVDRALVICSYHVTITSIITKQEPSRLGAEIDYRVEAKLTTLLIFGCEKQSNYLRCGNCQSSISTLYFQYKNYVNYIHVGS